MTDRQFEIYRCVVEYRTLGSILEHTGCKDSFALQVEAGHDALDFCDDALDNNTVVTLKNLAMEAYESRIRRDKDKSFTRCIAIYGAVMSTVAIVAEIMLHFL